MRSGTWVLGRAQGRASGDGGAFCQSPVVCSRNRGTEGSSDFEEACTPTQGSRRGARTPTQGSRRGARAPTQGSRRGAPAHQLRGAGGERAHQLRGAGGERAHTNSGEPEGWAGIVTEAR